MTQAEIDLLRSLSAPLVDNPLPWEALSPEQQSAFRLLMPDPTFADEQRVWIALWWLPVSGSQLFTINQQSPNNRVFTERLDVNGKTFVSVDLLSESLDDGQLAAVLPILQTLPLTYKLPDEWPVFHPEEEHP